jgi:hypothetical protein
MARAPLTLGSALALLALSTLGACENTTQPEAAPKVSAAPTQPVMAAAPEPLAACPHGEACGGAEAANAAAAVQPNSAGERVFGAGLKLAGPAVDVATVLADPAKHVGKVIQCEGTIARVCERMGCWMELKGPSAGQGLRVPMAGHSYFMPKDVVGRHAVVEGELTARGLTPDAKAHLESEGLKSVGPLSLAATGVVVR